MKKEQSMHGKVLLLCLMLVISISFLSAQAMAETFRIAVGIDPDSLDPAAFTTTTVGNMVEYMTETLFQIDQEGSLVPHLAKDWDVSEDGLAVSLYLKEGIYFHDGEPFNADAVKISFDRVLDPEIRVPQRSTFESIKSVEVVDTYTVKLHLHHPAAPLVNALSMTTMAILSPASLEERGNTYTNYQVPVGTGPYFFKEYRPSERLVVEINPDYWGKKPYYEEVIFQIVPEGVTRVSLLLAEQVDMIILPPVSEIPRLQENPNVEVLLAPSNRTIFIAINTTLPYLSDVRVRQALNYAVDVEEIIDKVLFGAADAMDAPMDPSLFGYYSIGEYEYNPEKAKELLAEAGATNLSLTMITPTGRYVQDFQATQAISGYLLDVGVQARVETMDWPSYVANITAAPENNITQLHLLGWAPSYLDAAQQMLQFYSPAAPPAGLATSFYNNPVVDELINNALQEVDIEERKDMYRQASEIIWEEAPWIFLWSQRFPIVFSNRVENISYLPNERFDALYARPKE